MCCRGCLLAMHWVIISWLAPFSHFSLSLACGLELCRTLVVHSSWSLSWDCMVFSSPLWCSFVVLLCGVPSCCSFVVLLRGVPSCCCTEVHGSKVNSIVVAGGLSVISPLGKEIWFPANPLLQMKKGFAYPGSWPFACSTPQVKVCNYKFLISKD